MLLLVGGCRVSDPLGRLQGPVPLPTPPWIKVDEMMKKVLNQPARQLDVPGEAEVCENDVELESDSILSPVDAIGHPLVDLVDLVYIIYNTYIIS